MLKYTCLLLTLLALFALSGCSDISSRVSQQLAIDAAWQDLDPITTSHNRANFEAVESRRVSGSEIAERFNADKINSYCWGAKITANAAVSPSTTYWYVVLHRRSMTELPVTRASPTDPPAIPDSRIYEAHFLVDGTTGQVVARYIPCIVY